MPISYHLLKGNYSRRNIAIVLPILGTTAGFTETQSKAPALSLGIALQLTNILRGVGEDAARGRIYLPLDELRTTA